MLSHFLWFFRKTAKHCNFQQLDQDHTVRASYLVREQWLDVIKQSKLRLERLAAVLRHVHDVNNGGAKMRQSGDRQHFDRVAILQWLVQYSRHVDHLEKEQDSSEPENKKLKFLKPVLFGHRSKRFWNDRKK